MSGKGGVVDCELCLEDDVRIYDAVSAVFVCEGELFMVRRQPYLPAFPGYHAFPGGKIDEDDAGEPPADPVLAVADGKRVNALIRELDEELGYDLPEAVRQGEVTSFSELGCATAPPFSPIRFRNFFYRIDVTRRPEFRVDEQEAEAWGWFSPVALMDRYEAGTLLAVPPVLRMLAALELEPGVRAIDDIDFTYDEETEVPCMELFADFFQLPVRSNTLPPADRTNAFVIGDTLIDPSPADDAELARLERTLARLSPSKILLTHHHPDHHERANILARKHDFSIWCSADTHARISEKWPGYFEMVRTRCIRDGEPLTRWRDQTVRVHAVPGHDEGQLGVAPDSLAWFIVGDLIQGIGTVVISAPEGNMKKYFASLERVIEMDPGIIIPSHGTAMGSTFRLRATLEHRQKREQQVLSLSREGHHPHAIVERVYQGLDPRLMPLALANVHAHLDKLREEDRLA